ncbi:MAG TPA: tetratricopeptide repeat protein [Verrucomicrobiae bacterium]|nr:tetratricopeptide repeat protein [Verrucomicrobiae bacterium]
MAEDFDTNHAVIELKKTFQEIRERFLVETNNPEIAWHFARACFDLADISTVNAQKAEFARGGIEAAERSLALNSNSPAAHYYLGMNIGELADTKRNLSALKMTKEMEREFLAAHAIDEHFDFAGADRNLGLLYLEAPVFFSVGDRAKGRLHLQAAVRLAPDFPENRLNLIEAYLKLGDNAEARKQLEELEKIWPEAQKQFTGDAWALSRADWNKRLYVAQKKLETASKVTASPHATK